MSFGPIAAFIVATLLSFVPGASTAGPVHRASVTDVTTGVWWAGQVAALPPSPPPPQVPKQDLWVSSTTAGAIAMSAVRFRVPTADRQPILIMAIDAFTSTPAAVATAGVDNGLHVLACPTTEAWSPPPVDTFGALSAAPAYDCAKGQVLGAQSLDGKSLVFELGGFISDTTRVVSIAVIPGQLNAPIPASPVPLPVAPPTPAQLPPTFDVTFKPVTPDAIEVLTNDAADGGEGDAVAVPPVEDAPAYEFIPVPSATLAPLAPAIAPRPRVIAFPRRIAQQAGVVKAGAQRSERTIAASVFLLLCMWAWTVAERNAVPVGATAGRPFRTLYDGATTSDGPLLRRIGTSARAGKPPPLR